MKLKPGQVLRGGWEDTEWLNKVRAEQQREDQEREMREQEQQKEK